MTPDKKSTSSTKKSISISGDVKDSAVIIGDNNVVNKTTVNQTIIQKFFNIFKSDTETLEHRNRRILLGHVENAWIKGVLDASLHGAALLDLGIKQDPEAVTKYPWAIQKESTKETLPAGTSMLEIFDSIGMGRSLLILGAPGSGKTTMLLELARQLIVRTRKDVTEPIPMVFNLASWTEKLTLADWLAQELNNLYSVPRKTAPDWVKGNKLHLLLDGLDEVRQESHAKCVEAINAFRKEHGWTSLVVCSRSQDYADLNMKLSFEGAIEVQPLTQKQITEFFNRFGNEIVGIKQALEKDDALREMAETPLFLSIMIMAYRGKRDVSIWVSQDEKVQRKHLFDTYVEIMFERLPTKNAQFKKQGILNRLSWIAQNMTEHNQVPYLIENMQPKWLGQKKRLRFRLLNGLIGGLSISLICGVSFGLIAGLLLGRQYGLVIGLFSILRGGLICGCLVGLLGLLFFACTGIQSEIKMIDAITWDWGRALKGLNIGLIMGLIFGALFGTTLFFIGKQGEVSAYEFILSGIIFGLIFGVVSLLSGALLGGLKVKSIAETIYPGQRLVSSIKISLLVLFFAELIFALSYGTIIWIVLQAGGTSMLLIGVILAFLIGLIGWLLFGGFAIIQHYLLRLLLNLSNLLPWRLVPFLDHCVDLIFLRRVGGGYIFVHRLLMEHFAEMYVETPTSKGN